MARLRLHNISKIFDKNIYACRNVSFDVADQEFAVLVGPSGCGKTTLLRLIAGLETADQGEIIIDDRVVNDISPKDRDVAMVFQNYALYPHMTVYDNIAFGLRVRKFKENEIKLRIDQVTEILEIDKLLQRKPRQLSGGQRQRVAVGRAIVRKPKIFLFDEPLSNLDAKLRVQMRAELSRLHKKIKATIVYVTHDQTEAMTLGQRIVVMKDGEVQQIADPRMLYRKPCNRFVAGFIGNPPMNFIKGTITRQENALTFKNQDISIPVNARIEDLDQHEVIIGIRPADFNLEKGLPIELTVDIIEPLGNEVIVHGRWGSIPITARLEDDKTPAVGGQLQVRIDPDRFYVFDAKNDEAIA
jgi:multiple sugar transport system ATP-binding protein